MGLTVNDFEPLHLTHRTEDERPTVTIEYIGGSVPRPGSTGTVSISGRVGYYGAATCVSSEVNATTGDLLRGTASFRVV